MESYAIQALGQVYILIPVGLIIVYFRFSEMYAFVYCVPWQTDGLPASDACCIAHVTLKTLEYMFTL